MADATRQKSYAGITLEFPGGLVQLKTSAVAVRRKEDKEGKTSYACPDCSGPVAQQYTCIEHGHGPHEPANMVRAIAATDGTKTALDAGELASLNDDSIVVGRFELETYPSAPVMAAMLPDQTVYRLRPDGKDTSLAAYAALREWVATHPEFVLLGEVKPTQRDKPRPYILVVWGDLLVMQSMIRPTEINPFETVEATPDAAKVGPQVNALLQMNVQEFDPQAFADRRRERRAALAAAKADPALAAVVAMPAPVEKTSADDLAAMLAASVAAIEAKKAS